MPSFYFTPLLPLYLALRTRTQACDAFVDCNKTNCSVLVVNRLRFEEEVPLSKLQQRSTHLASIKPSIIWFIYRELIPQFFTSVTLCESVYAAVAFASDNFRAAHAFWELSIWIANKDTRIHKRASTSHSSSVLVELKQHCPSTEVTAPAMTPKMFSWHMHQKFQRSCTMLSRSCWETHLCYAANLGCHMLTLPWDILN